MLNQIKDSLSDITNPKTRKNYLNIINTLLDKGYFPGLKGIPIVESKISNIDGENGVLTFRGYPVEELAHNFTYEDICFLLLKGELPLKEEQKNLREQLLKNKEIDYNIAKIIAAMDENLHPMSMLSASVLLMQSNDCKSSNTEKHDKNIEQVIRLIAKLPTIIGIYRTKDPDFGKNKFFNSFAEYCLYSFNKEFAEEKKWVDIFEKTLILHADHTLNNSTFSVRAVGSSQASIYASIASAINSLSGPLHGGANEKVIKILEEIKSPQQVQDYVDKSLAQGNKIMGVGHRVYRTYDPRALYLKNNILPAIFNKGNLGEIESSLENLYNTAQKLEKVVLERLGGKKIYPNVDFWSGLIFKAIKIEPEYFTTIFALGRVMGWCAHWIENLDIKNSIFRPQQLYNGYNIRHISNNSNEQK